MNAKSEVIDFQVVVQFEIHIPKLHHYRFSGSGKFQERVPRRLKPPDDPAVTGQMNLLFQSKRKTNPLQRTIPLEERAEGLTTMTVLGFLDGG